jgi:hypothetical protein
MLDLNELLAAEAVRQQPTQPPPFADIVRVYRRRNRRRHTIGASALVLAFGAIGLPPLLDGQSPQASTSPASVPVTGILVVVAGRPGLTPTIHPVKIERGVPGTVWFKASNGTYISTPADADGRFRILLTPGRYRVTGHPAYLDDSSPPGIVDTSVSPGAVLGGAPSTRTSQSAIALPPPLAPTAAGASSGIVEFAPDDLDHQACWAEDPVDVTTHGAGEVQVLCQTR